jgi:mono/diheme cytochrome c family protein
MTRANVLAVVASLLAASALGCGAGPHTRGAGAVAPLAVRPVAWNPAGTPVGKVQAVADAGSVVAVFGDAGATVFSSGAAVATDRSVTAWVDARAIRGADGAARWIVGVDARGHLYYLRGLSSFEDVSARYGLDGRRVLSAAMLDPTHVGFLLDRQIAVADGRRVTLYPTAPLATLFGNAGFGAGVGTDAVFLFDTAHLTSRTFPLRGVTRAAVGPDGRLYASTSRALYAATEQGDLALLYDAGGDTLHGLATSGDHVWFADGAELGIVQGDQVAETSGAHVAADARLAASPTGDGWVLSGGGLQRYARADAEPSLSVRWSTTLSPIFARSCAGCHLPGGVSGTDLSTAEAWHSERPAIRDRVVVTKTMPPEGHPLSDADRDAIKAWTEGP